MNKSAVMCGQKFKLVWLSAVFLVTTMAYLNVFLTYLTGILISFNMLDCLLLILMDEMTWSVAIINLNMIARSHHQCAHCPLVIWPGSYDGLEITSTFVMDIRSSLSMKCAFTWSKGSLSLLKPWDGRSRITCQNSIKRWPPVHQSSIYVLSLLTFSTHSMDNQTLPILDASTVLAFLQTDESETNYEVTLPFLRWTLQRTYCWANSNRWNLFSSSSLQQLYTYSYENSAWWTQTRPRRIHLLKEAWPQKLQELDMHKKRPPAWLTTSASSKRATQVRQKH